LSAEVYSRAGLRPDPGADGPDERGSVISISDGAGDTTDINLYDAYGRPGASNAGRFQYTGQIWLSEGGIGLYHYKARAYSPYLGRFLQTDTIGFGDGMNLYAYVGGDPVNFTDPSGLAQEDLIGCTRETTSGSCVNKYGVEFICTDAGCFIDPNGQYANDLYLVSDDSAVNPNWASYNDDRIVVTAPRKSFRSDELLRWTVPGQISYDYAVEAYLNEEYLNAALFGATMLAEQVFAVATVGQGDKITRLGKSVVAAGGKLLGPTGPVIGRQRLGGGSLFNINNNPYLRFGWGYRQSTDDQVIRFSGRYVEQVTGQTHIDTWITTPNP
jgi:RHS repeat-associated protein